jgi:hypothetical protein
VGKWRLKGGALSVGRLRGHGVDLFRDAAVELRESTQELLAETLSKGNAWELIEIAYRTYSDISKFFASCIVDTKSLNGEV